MTKRILATSLVVAALGTSVFAYNQNCQNGDRDWMRGQKQEMMQKGMNDGGGMMQKGMRRGMDRMDGMDGRMFAELNLSDEQRYQLSILKDEMMLEMKKSMGMKKRGQMQDFLSEKGFDKEGFVKSMNEQHSKMLKLKVAHMEKVFALLTPEQKAKLQAKN